jgi:hypothetical protein
VKRIADLPNPRIEDFVMRGRIWANGSYPGTWFSNDNIDLEEKHVELAAMSDNRKERIL